MGGGDVELNTFEKVGESEGLKWKSISIKGERLRCRDSSEKFLFV